MNVPKYPKAISVLKSVFLLDPSPSRYFYAGIRNEFRVPATIRRNPAASHSKKGIPSLPAELKRIMKVELLESGECGQRRKVAELFASGEV